VLRLRTHDDLPFELADAVPRHAATVLIAFRGPWCPYCRAYWDEVKDLAAEFEAAGAVVYGLSADKPKALRKFRDKRELPFTLLSDPKLTSRKILEIRRERNHPKSGDYDKGAFLQPAIFVWTPDGKLRYHWKQRKAALDNMFGMARRPTAEKVLRKVKKALRPPETAQPLEG